MKLLSWSVLASCLASAKTTDSCGGDVSTCKSQEEDAAMVQLAKVGVPYSKPQWKSFAQNSKPFLGSNGGLLHGDEQGKILIDEDGVMNTYYLPGATTIDGGKTVKYTPPYRFYLMKTPTTDYSNADNFYKPAFAGKTFSVDIDFGADGASCGCNLNFYLVDMPTDTPGQDLDYYCDAQCFDGLGCCSEFDMNEGNNEVQQITNHACTSDYDGHPDWACHKWGNPEVKTQVSGFGPGSQHTIDSRKPFTFSQEFGVAGDDFTFTTRISQDGRDLVMPMGPGSDQLNAMLKVIQKGMVFVTGYWFAKDMNWMDGDGCGSGAEHCNMNPAYISNWRLTSNGSPVPAPPTPPSPNPSPPPSPVPVEGKCCWQGQCNGCNEDPTSWCNQSPDRCESSCGGSWCSGR